MNATAPLSRRSFARALSLAAGALMSLLALPSWRARARGGGSDGSSGDRNSGAMPSWGMAIDLDRCTGCGACVVACRTENNVPTRGPEPELRGTQISWMELLPQGPQGPGAGPHPDALPLPCLHCDDPPCVKVCPVGATYQTEDGIVAQISDRCIGCRYCEVACPYSRRYFNWVEPSWPESHLSFLNPDVATRPKGVVEKCTFCHHRIRSAREKARIEDQPLADEDLQRLPACAEVCPAQAIVFGDLNDQSSRVSQLSRSARAFRLLEHLGTRPKVTYLSKDRRQ
ncbi:MAG: 4Fe-4S dicluster domain-containing protein [Myxococcota bacterium]